MLVVADFFKLLTEACVDFLRRDFSSAFRSIGSSERMGMRLSGDDEAASTVDDSVAGLEWFVGGEEVVGSFMVSKCMGKETNQRKY